MNFEMIFKKKKKKSQKDIIDIGIAKVDKGLRQAKKKIRTFYKLNIFFAFFLAFFLSYYLILAQIKPFSSNFLKEKFNSYLAENYGKNYKIEDAKISFTYKWRVKISLIDLKINNKEETQEIAKLPQIDIRFAIAKLIFFNFKPYEVRIFDANCDEKMS